MPDKKILTELTDVETFQRLPLRYTENADGTYSVSTNQLGQALVARQLTVSSTSTNTVLSTAARKITMYATADTRFSIGSSPQTASPTSHFIAAGERLDLSLPITPNIAVILASGGAGTLELSEIS